MDMCACKWNSLLERIDVDEALVTGGAGFIGSNLVDQLIDDGNDVFIFDDLSSGKSENINPKAWFDYQVDIATCLLVISWMNKFVS